MRTNRQHPLEIKYKTLRKQGYSYLKRGVLFLVICLAIGQFIGTLNIPFGHFLVESLAIVGWVALWKPLEILLYELPELKEEWKKSLKQR